MRKRNATLIGAVVAVHVAAAAVILLAPEPPTLGTPLGGGSGVTVTLVSGAPQPSPAPQKEVVQPPKPEGKPVEKPVEKPVIKTVKAPVSKPAPLRPHVLTSQVAQAPSIEQHAEVAAKAAAVSAPPVPATPPSTPAPAATASATPSAPAQSPAMNKTQPASAASGPAKTISAQEMGQLGCRIPTPVYPLKAKRLEQTGVVSVSLMIGVDGRIGNVKVAKSSGYPLLDQAAVAAVSAGACHPYTSAGQAVPVTTVQPVAFGLND
jgi:protein TonB